MLRLIMQNIFFVLFKFICMNNQRVRALYTSNVRAIGCKGFKKIIIQKSIFQKSIEAIS